MYSPVHGTIPPGSLPPALADSSTEFHDQDIVLSRSKERVMIGCFDSLDKLTQNLQLATEECFIIAFYVGEDKLNIEKSDANYQIIERSDTTRYTILTPTLTPLMQVGVLYLPGQQDAAIQGFYLYRHFSSLYSPKQNFSCKAFIFAEHENPCLCPILAQVKEPVSEVIERKRTLFKLVCTLIKLTQDKGQKLLKDLKLPGEDGYNKNVHELFYNACAKLIISHYRSTSKISFFGTNNKLFAAIHAFFSKLKQEKANSKDVADLKAAIMLRLKGYEAYCDNIESNERKKTMIADLRRFVDYVRSHLSEQERSGKEKFIESLNKIITNFEKNTKDKNIYAFKEIFKDECYKFISDHILRRYSNDNGKTSWLNDFIAGAEVMAAANYFPTHLINALKADFCKAFHLNVKRSAENVFDTEKNVVKDHLNKYFGINLENNSFENYANQIINFLSQQAITLEQQKRTLALMFEGLRTLANNQNSNLTHYAVSRLQVVVNAKWQKHALELQQPQEDEDEYGLETTTASPTRTPRSPTLLSRRNSCYYESTLEEPEETKEPEKPGEKRIERARAFSQ